MEGCIGQEFRVLKEVGIHFQGIALMGNVISGVSVVKHESGPHLSISMRTQAQSLVLNSDASKGVSTTDLCWEYENEQRLKDKSSTSSLSLFTSERRTLERVI